MNWVSTMNNEIKFKNLQELYERILQNLKSKVKEIRRKGIDYIHEEDIWNYLKRYKWTSSRSLDLGDMVNDIFNTEIKELDSFVKEEFKDLRRNIIKEETI